MKLPRLSPSIGQHPTRRPHVVNAPPFTLRRFMDTGNSAGVGWFQFVELIAMGRLRVKDEQSVAVSLGFNERTELAPVREVAKELMNHPVVAMNPDPPAVLILFLLINPADVSHGIYFDFPHSLHLPLA